MIKFAIVGTGKMAHTHAKRFAEQKGVRLVACCDVDREKAQSFAREFGIPVVCSDLKTLLATTEVDAISNVTSDAFHAPLSIEALKAGKHVFCEKPLATTHAEAVRMARVARASGKVAMVNFSYRNSAAFQHVARRIHQGDLGRILHVSAHYLQSWLVSKEWGDWRTDPIWLWRLSTRHGSKGVLGDVGVHILDFASFPVGEISEVMCELRTFPKGGRKRIGEYRLDANDSAAITLRYDNGALGSIETTRLATGHLNSIRLSIHGETGAFRIDLDTSYVEYEECFVRKTDGKTTPWRKVAAPAVPTLYQRFVRAVRTGTNDQPDFDRGAEIQRVLDACVTSDKTGRAVLLRR